MMPDIGLGANQLITTVDLESLERKYSGRLDAFFGLAVAIGVAGLFIIDISQPRGVVDGVGYAAMVALSVRFGSRAVIACAVLTTFLTLIASIILPDSGISVGGMWANRGFAIAEIWIVAAILLRRLWLEEYIAGRERKLQEHQAALGKIVREALLSDKPRDERIRCIVEMSAETMQADLAAILLERENSNMIQCVDAWDRRAHKHFRIPDFPVNDAPGYRASMRDDLIVLADDVFKSEIHRDRLDFLKSVNVRAMLAADTFMNNRGSGAVGFAFNEPHHWTTQEIAFARAVANLVALLFSASRTADSLATLDQVSEAIYAEDSDGGIRYVNRAARELARGGTGRKALFPRPDIALSGNGDMHEIRFEGRELEIQRTRLPEGGILTRINDVTARNAALSDRRKLESRLQQSAKMEAIGQLAGGVAHDFNNILGSILGFAGFLAQDLPERSAERGFAERILAACERGKDLVEQILAFARARAIERGVVDLGLLLKRNRDFLSTFLPKQIALNMDLTDSALPVFGSAVQIGQLITNLCQNARDAFDGKQGVIAISSRVALPEEIAALKKGVDAPDERAFGDVHAERPYCLLRVEDNGPGIPPEILDRIFEPFFTTKGRHRGTGLGLAVVHGVVQTTGGACHVRSIPGKGTVFSIYFPLVSQAENLAGPVAGEPQDLRGSERILIVDDERDIADMLAIGLERLGYETVGVNDPLEALAAFTEDSGAFDIVITDQVMPGMRGLELIRRLKEIRPAIKGVLCTGFSDGANEEVARAAGADAFFNKPVDARQIAPALRLLMERTGKE